MESQFEIAMSQKEQELFFADISIDTEESIKMMLGKIDVEKSQSFNPVDRDRIFAIVKETVGFPALNSVVFERLRQWAKDVVMTAIESGQLDAERKLLMRAALGHLLQQQSDYFKAKEVYNLLYDEFVGHFGDSHLETIKLSYYIAKVCGVTSDYIRAEELFRMIIDKQFQVNGYPLDPWSLQAKQMLGTLYQNNNKLDLALQYYNEAYEGMEKHMGDRDDRTISALGDLAAHHSVHGDKGLARQLLEKQYLLSKEVLGENHPSTLDVRYNMGCQMYDEGKLDFALYVIQDVYERRVVLLGEQHISTLNTMETMGFIHQALDNMDKAQEFLEKRVQICSAFFGPKSLLTLNYKFDFAKWLYEIKKYQHAEIYFIDSWKGFCEVKGPNSAYALNVFKSVKRVLTKRGKKNEIPSLEEEYEAMKKNQDLNPTGSDPQAVS